MVRRPLVASPECRRPRVQEIEIFSESRPERPAAAVTNRPLASGGFALTAVPSSAARLFLEVRAEDNRPREHQEGSVELFVRTAPRSACALTCGPDDHEEAPRMLGLRGRLKVARTAVLAAELISR